MKDRYIGFDQLTLNQNGFELFKDGKPFLSLYHDCELIGLKYEGQTMSLKLSKTHDSGYGPRQGSHPVLRFTNAVVESVTLSDTNGNFEDINELTPLEQGDDCLKIKISVGSMNFVLTVSAVELLIED